MGHEKIIRTWSLAVSLPLSFGTAHATPRLRPVMEAVRTMITLPDCPKAPTAVGALTHSLNDASALDAQGIVLGAQELVEALRATRGDWAASLGSPKEGIALLRTSAQADPTDVLARLETGAPELLAEHRVLRTWLTSLKPNEQKAQAATLSTPTETAAQTRVIDDIYLAVRVTTTVTNTEVLISDVTKLASPLALDLGHGIHTRAVSDGMELASHPTWTSDRLKGVARVRESKERVGHFQEWFSPETGVLVLPHGTGPITARDLFGDRFVTGRSASNGFEDLRRFDRNGDNKIDMADPVWDRLRVWKGGSADGTGGTLLTLEEAGVESISLDYKASDNPIARFSSRYGLQTIADQRLKSSPILQAERAVALAPNTRFGPPRLNLPGTPERYEVAEVAKTGGIVEEADGVRIFRAEGATDEWVARFANSSLHLDDWLALPLSDSESALMMRVFARLGPNELGLLPRQTPGLFGNNGIRDIRFIASKIPETDDGARLLRRLERSYDLSAAKVELAPDRALLSPEPAALPRAPISLGIHRNGSETHPVGSGGPLARRSVESLEDLRAVFYTHFTGGSVEPGALLPEVTSGIEMAIRKNDMPLEDAARLYAIAAEHQIVHTEWDSYKGRTIHTELHVSDWNGLASRFPKTKSAAKLLLRLAEAFKKAPSEISFHGRALSAWSASDFASP